jgi:hypothetical protein
VSAAADSLSEAVDGGGGKLAAVGSFLWDNWQLVGALLLAGTLAGLAYRQGRRDGAASVGGYYYDDDALEGEEG